MLSGSVTTSFAPVLQGKAGIAGKWAHITVTLAF